LVCTAVSASRRVGRRPDGERGADLVIDRLGANSALPGELSQVLPSPQHLEQVIQVVTRDSTRDSIAYGTNLDRYLDAFRP
jgi:hypothetical protein